MIRVGAVVILLFLAAVITEAGLWQEVIDLARP